MQYSPKGRSRFSNFKFDTDSSASHSVHALAAGRIWFLSLMGRPHLFLPLELPITAHVKKRNVSCVGIHDIGITQMLSPLVSIGSL